MSCEFTITRGDVVIYGVRKTLNGVLCLIRDEILFGWNLRCELEQIHNSLTKIVDSLQKLEDSITLRFEDDDLSDFLRGLKEVAYEAEDIFDDLAYEYLKTKVSNSIPFFKFHKNVFSVKLADQLEKLNRSLQEYAHRHFTWCSPRLMPDIKLDKATDLVVEDSIIGRENDVSKIVNLVTSCCGHQILTVVPIVGMDGCRKTTLAKLVCEQLMGRKLFDVHIWVSCSQLFHRKTIFMNMLLSLDGTIECLTDLRYELEKRLARKKTLVVLDDVRSDYVTWWNDLLQVFTNNGNAVLVTTSMHGVASIIESSSQHRHNLDLLSDEECWLIMKEKAFGNMTTPFPSNLEAIGREIARSCGGLPLVAKVVGGTLGLNLYEEAWLKIRDRNVFFRGDSLEDVKSSLRKSFEQLPPSLKSCIALCSAYKKGISIPKEEFIHVWMAEGIIDSFDQGNKHFHALLQISFFQDVETSEDGDVIQCKVNDLVHDLAFSIFEFKTMKDSSRDSYRVRLLYVDYTYLIVSDYRRNIDSVARAVKLRTLILDHAPICESWMLESLRSLNVNGTDMEMLPSIIGKLTRLRFLSVSNTKLTSLPESITNLYHLQTLNLSYSNMEKLPRSISKLHNLQTLNLKNSKVKQLPNSITKLHQLQSLNVSNTPVNQLPRSIGKLQNLQTLNVSYCYIKEFPESITKLRNLKILKFLGCQELFKFPRKEMKDLINLKNISFSYEHQMPIGLGQLTCLQILPLFVVGFDMGGSIAELQFLNELRGDLKITRLEEVRHKEEAKRANLQAKIRLQGLSFQWSSGKIGRNSSDEELLEGLRPNPNIKRIMIKNYMAENWPSWMLQKKCLIGVDSLNVLNNLVDLTLEQCWNNAKIPRLGDLPYLKSLKINHMGSVKCIDNDFYWIDTAAGSSTASLKLFPSLKSLSVSWMENLIEWSCPLDGKKIIVFPCLENLSIQYCSKLASFPFSVVSALVKIEIKDCEELRFIFHEKHSFPHLTSLSIMGCPKLTYLRNWLLSGQCYRAFSVRRCQWLMFVQEDLGQLSALTSLDIYCCKRLRCFSEEILGGLRLLKHLSIGAFSKELDDFRYLNRIKDLPWLEDLEIWGSDFLGRQMSLLPKQLQQLTALKSLKITGFTSMEALPEWLTNLQSLSSLSLNYCRNLRSQSTVVIIKQLSNLATLYINCCPVLEEGKSDLLRCLNRKKIKAEFSNVRD